MNEELQIIEKSIRRQQSTYFGKYRAFVTDNQDPDGLGRVKMTIPSVLGEASSDWALPSMAYGGGSQFGVLWVPPVGAQVLAEFLEGDPSAPLWAGTFWRQSAEVPSEYRGPSTKVLKTESGHFLTFDDEEGSEAITLHSATNTEILMDAEGSISLTDSVGAKVTLDAGGEQISVKDANGNSVLLSASGISCTDSSGNEFNMGSSGIEVKSSALITLEGSQVAIAGAGGEPLIKGTTFLSMFNSHTHVTPHGPSGPPVPPLTPSVLTTKSTAK